METYWLTQLIDKLYTMMFELYNGKIQTPTSLQYKFDKFSIPDILSLPLPKGRVFGEATPEDADIIELSSEEIKRALNEEDITIWKNVLEGTKTKIRFDEGVSPKAAKRFIDLLNTHEKTKLSKSAKEVGLRNKIMSGIYNITTNIRSTIASSIPITMDDLHDIAKDSTLSDKEKRFTSDNPATKFIMQVQNMVGKQGIGIQAVGLKVFFAATSYCNMLINDLAAQINEFTIVANTLSPEEYQKRQSKLQQNVLEFIRDIAFDKKSLTSEGSNEIGCLANLNFSSLALALKAYSAQFEHELAFNPRFLTQYYDGNAGAVASQQDFKSKVPSYFSGKVGPLTLSEVVSDLQKSADKVDAANSLSELISASTDNAKELILSKINATTEFADAWSHLSSRGYSFREIADLLMSPVFSLVPKYAQLDITTDITKQGSVSNAIEFLLGRADLTGVDTSLLKSIVYYRGEFKNKNFVNKEYNNDRFVDKLYYETWLMSDKDTLIATYGADWISHVGEIKLDKDNKPIVRKPPIIALRDISGFFEKNSELAAKLYSMIQDPTNLELAELMSSILESHLFYVGERGVDHKKRSTNDDFDGEPDPEEESIPEEEPIPEPGEESEGTRYVSDTMCNDNTLQFDKVGTKRLYRYYKHYVLPKFNSFRTKVGVAKGTQTFDENVYKQAIKNLEFYASDILPAVDEQAILGAILGVNQGLKTNVYDFIGRLKRLEGFINRKIKVSNQNTSESYFDVIRFLSDESVDKEGKTYADRWIEKYDTMKSTYNILKVIKSVPNFREMYNLNLVGHKFLSMASIYTLTEKLSNSILPNHFTSKLNEKEYKQVHNWARDLLLSNFIFSQNISFKVPTCDPQQLGSNPSSPKPLYEKDSENPESEWTPMEVYNGVAVKVSGMPEVTIDSMSSMASFVNIFENWIVPYLTARYTGRGVKDNAFVKNLSYNDYFRKIYSQRENHVKIDMNLSGSNANAETQKMFSDIAEAFNDIANDVIPQIGMKIKDAFFLYNTIVYKNGFSNGSFTKLMEHIIGNDPSALVNKCAQFFSDFDSKKIDCGDLFDDTKKTITISTSGTLKLGKLSGNIKDLLFRMAIDPATASKLNVAIERNESSQKITGFSYINSKTKEKENTQYFYAGFNINDWAMLMPYMSKEEARIVLESGMKYEGAGIYRYENEQVVYALLNNLSKLFGIDEKVHYITRKDLFNDLAGDNKFGIKLNGKRASSVVADINGFVRNGEIYIVADSLFKNDTSNTTVGIAGAKASTLVHELSHLIFAAMKYSQDPAMRKQYYTLLENTWNGVGVTDLERHRRTRSEVRDMYGMEKGSDLKEEFLVYKIEQLFDSEFDKSLEVTDLNKFVIDKLNEIFKLKSHPISSKVNMAKLGATTLSDLAMIYHSDLLSNPFDESLIELTDNVKFYKQKLIKAGERVSEGENLKNYITYDC